MKIFAIKDEYNDTNVCAGYLIYYESTREFYVEISEDADYWDVPMILSGLVKKGTRTINSYWSRQWMQQRIVPPDRQNLSQILRDNGLKEYDEYSLLMLADGRCEQDNYYLEPVKILPIEYEKRFGKHIEDVMIAYGKELLVFFKNGQIKRINLEKNRQ